MKKAVITLITGVFLLATNSFAGSKAHWGYSGDGCPENWGKLDPAYSACDTGVNQSPINLTGFIEADLPSIDFTYSTAAYEIINNGHTVQAVFSKGSSINIDNIKFNLLQCHFHAPSENTVENKSFPMEGHCVHASDNGKLAVVAIMYEAGKANEGIAGLWDKMPHKNGDKNKLVTKVNADLFMPADKDYYRFNGSLTTPPCTEGVRWIVLKNSVSVSQEQIDKFVRVMHHPNNRPVQPVNARIIAK